MATNARFRALKRKIQRMINRWRAILMHTALHHSRMRKESIQKRSAPSPDKARKRQQRLGKMRDRRQGRSRNRDRGVAKAAKEEQLWQLKSNALREKSRDRKQQAMDRWTITATTSGNYRGL